MTEKQAQKMGLKPIYAPQKNPLAPSKLVKGYVQPSTGKFIPPHFRKPPFRHVVGYRP